MPDDAPAPVGAGAVATQILEVESGTAWVCAMTSIYLYHPVSVSKPWSPFLNKAFTNQSGKKTHCDLPIG